MGVRRGPSGRVLFDGSKEQVDGTTRRDRQLQSLIGPSRRWEVSPAGQLTHRSYEGAILSLMSSPHVPSSLSLSQSDTPTTRHPDVPVFPQNLRPPYGFFRRGPGRRGPGAPGVELPSDLGARRASCVRGASSSRGRGWSRSWCGARELVGGGG